MCDLTCVTIKGKSDVTDIDLEFEIQSGGEFINLLFHY